VLHALIIGDQAVDWRGPVAAYARSTGQVRKTPMVGDGGRPDAGSLAGPDTEDYAAMVAGAIYPARKRDIRADVAFAK